MLEASIFKKRRLLKKTQINRLLQEQDRHSLAYLHTEVDIGRIIEFKNQTKSAESMILRLIYLSELPSEAIEVNIQQDLFFGVNSKNIYDEIVNQYPDAYVLYFENLDNELIHLEFCKLVAQMKKIMEYKYVFLDDRFNNYIPLDTIISFFHKRNNSVIFPTEYRVIGDKKIMWSDLSGVKIDNCFYKLKYPVRNVPKNKSFLTTTSVFEKVHFKKFSFSITCSIFYSFLVATESFLCKDFTIELII